MSEKYVEVKKALLDHVQSLFEEMAEEMALSHQEKFALLEDALNNATDVDELKVAFEHWFNEHVDDIGWNYKSNEVWNLAAGDSGLEVVEDYDDDEDEEVEKNLEGFGSDEEKDDEKGNFKNSDEY